MGPRRRPTRDEQRLRGLLDLGEDAALVCADDGRILWASRAARELLGADAEPVGRDLRDVLHPDDGLSPESVGEHPASIMCRLRSGRWVRASCRRGAAPDDAAGEILLVLRDISELIAHRDEREAFSQVADELALMLEAADEASREQEAIAGLAREIARGEIGPAGILEMVAEVTDRLTGARAAAVARLDPDGLVTLVGRSGWLEDLGAVRLDASGTPLADLGKGDPVVSGPFQAVLTLADGEQRMVDCEDGIAVPVELDGAIWGAVAASGLGEAAPERALERLARFADLAAVAIAASETRARLLTQATQDPLTGLANHGTFHAALAEAWTRGPDAPLAVALLDIDHFKRVNDTHGHATGDATLREVSRRIADVARMAGGLVARIGGEEFAWLLDGAAAAGAGDALEVARLAVGSAPVPEVGTVTVSAGVANRSGAGSPQELLEQADAALYASKRGGRNRVTLHATGLDAGDPARAANAIGGLRGLARAVDAKDAVTGAHCERVAVLARRIAVELGWGEADADRLEQAAYLHDVGKIGVPDAILTKPGELDDAEWDVMRRHPVLGAAIAAECLDPEQASWILHHHERWDGTGYPVGLAGPRVPEGARIIALASSWDAMTWPSRYGGRRDPEAAAAEIRRHRGTQFWPEGADALLACVAEGAPAATAP